MKTFKGVLVMGKKTTALEVIEKDIEAVYLGNLRTVEFDLDLPQKGRNGSMISWTSKDERFITSSGKVTRPAYGKGDRVIELTAMFGYDDETKYKTYEAKVLEEENDIQVAKIYPVVIKEQVGHYFYLPQVVSVKTKSDEVLAHSVVWNEEKMIYSEEGIYQVAGRLKDTDYCFVAKIEITEKIQTKNHRDKKADAFPLKSVRLTGNSMIKTAQDQQLKFLLSVNDDQMLYNFRKAADIDTKGAPAMIGWDSPDSLLKGHTTGHYLSALALCYAATGNRSILKKSTYMIDALNEVQLAFENDPNYHYGFISGYPEKQFDLLEEYVPYPQIWAPYYTLHKIFAGLLDSYEIAGIDRALTIADKLGDWTYARLSRLSHDQLKKMWGMYIAGEFGGMNESLAELYRLTQKKEHLKAAMLFDNDRLFFPMEQKIDALGALHANQHIPQIVGALKIYEVSDLEKYYQIADFFWNSVTSAHIYSIGGTGEGEMFQQPNVIGKKLDEHTAETCASYNMLKLTKGLFQYEPTSDKADYYERTMLNHILSSADHEGIGGSTYFMPTNPGAQKGFDVDNSCCHGTGLENHFKYGEAVFFSDPEALFINLFMSAHLQDEKTGLDVELIADEAIPEMVTINVNHTDRNLKIRKPYWSKTVVITVNGKKKAVVEADNYLFVEVSSGDRVIVNFKITYRFEATADVPELVSIAYGPYILAILDDQSEYLTFSKDPEALKKIVKSAESLDFSMGKMKLKPLAQVNHEHFHLYVKMV